MMRRRRQIAARNAILLQQQHQQPNTAGQWGGPPPGQGPFGGGYPMQPNNTGYGGPQPYQPGYTGGYTSPGAPKGYEAYPNTTPGVQEPARSYNPDQPFHVRNRLVFLNLVTNMMSTEHNARSSRIRTT